MKKYGGFIIYSLIFVLLTSLCLTAFANEVGISPDNATKNVDSYRVDFQKNILFNSNAMKNNLQAVSSDLNEIVFTVDAGDDTFTIGYYLGNETYSQEKVVREIKKTVDELNDTIKTEERLSSNNHISLDNLQLTYIIVDTPDPVNDIKASLSGVASCKRIATTPTTAEIAEHKAITNASARAGTIAGSYHHQIYIGNNYYTQWYDQWTDTSLLCPKTLSSPHAGDGNDRYDAGFPWIPNEVDVNFYTDVATNENQTKLWYMYYTPNLNNLNVDSNEALEMEVTFYNYTSSSTPYDKKGNAFQLIKDGATWYTNQPNSYLDTGFGDSNTKINFCVGVDDTSDLTAGRWYLWHINGTKGITSNNYPNDGRFLVTAQRGYRLLGSGAWSVFAEEHDAIRRLGITSNQNWVPADENAWIYAASNDDWNFDIATDPVT